MNRKKMPRYRLDYAADWRDAPMAYWVHVEPAGQPWRDDDAALVPPAPRPHGRRGYPLLLVESQGVVFRFSSAEQVLEGIRILGLPRLPTTRRLSALRGGGHGPNSHWLSRLPGSVKAPRARRRAVADLRAVALALDLARQPLPAPPERKP